MIAFSMEIAIARILELHCITAKMKISFFISGLLVFVMDVYVFIIYHIFDQIFIAVNINPWQSPASPPRANA